MVLTNTRGAKQRIVACWLEASENSAYRPTFVALTMNIQDGAFYKVNLPDPDWHVAA